MSQSEPGFWKNGRNGRKECSFEKELNLLDGPAVTARPAVLVFVMPVMHGGVKMTGMPRIIPPPRTDGEGGVATHAPVDRVPVGDHDIPNLDIQVASQVSELRSHFSEKRLVNLLCIL